jgi:hypothetical protein
MRLISQGLIFVAHFACVKLATVALSWLMSFQPILSRFQAV